MGLKTKAEYIESIRTLKPTVGRFSAFLRQSHGGCKSGKIDCMIGAARTTMEYNGTSSAGHLKQKVIDMIHRAETLYGCSLAASLPGGLW